jgi:hypothetical protein
MRISFYDEDLSHLARAAFWAISFNRSGLSFLARASPPFLPPSLPRATAAGFFLRGGSLAGSVGGDDSVSDSPAASSTMARASWLMSRGLDFLLDRLGMTVVCHGFRWLASFPSWLAVLSLAKVMNAPERFAAWLSTHEHHDRRFGYVYRYHPRSNAHSIILCTYILEDLLAQCPALQVQASRGEVAFGINLSYIWPTTQKAKNLDLAVGPPATPILLGKMVEVKSLGDVFLACEAKSVMTEHVKSQPRVYDELSSSHEIVHQGRAEAIAAGITVVNIATTFASPTRQTPAAPLYISLHAQPDVTERMVRHLRGLPIREHIGQVGFDAYCTIVVECDNQSGATLWDGPPAPQPRDRDHYETFIERLARFYTERFSIIH